ncbi:DUF924 family protein [Comamonas sp. J-3]|uniref:DUF924 family protein n=1 Tax=Comamonas trifloxystrobinivorans TaxID=3350256 RepID=UPI003728F1F3
MRRAGKADLLQSLILSLKAHAVTATTASAPIATPDSVLHFWFGSARPSNADALRNKQIWFAKSDELDEQIRQQFGPAVEAAMAGGLADWEGEPWSALALIVLLDQFSRNIYRNTAQAFAGDARALALSHRMQAQGQDQLLPAVVRVFVYLPMEHSEVLAEQARSVQAFTDLVASAAGDETLQSYLRGSLDYAFRHQQVIAEFGRFPHRNAALGRSSTAAEQAYLAQPGAGF